MNSIFRWWGLALFAALAALWWLCIDLVIEKTIEFAGTQAVGARVELSSAELQLSPTRLTLSGLQVTNPDEPMQNLFESKQIALALDGLSLLRRQFIAEEMAVTGLQLYTERETSGAIDRRLLSFGGSGEDGEGFALPGLELPDTDAMLDAEKARIQGEIDAINAEFKDIEQQWQQRVDSLPTEEQLQQYRERWEALKDANPIQRIAGARELKKDIDRELQAINAMNEAMRNDKERVNALIKQAASLPEREAERLLASVGLDQGFDGMIRSLLGDKAVTWMQRGLSLYQQTAGQLGGGEPEAEAEPEPVRGKGENLRFSSTEPLPDFLIKTAKIDGIAPVAGQQIRFAGEIHDITDDQALWGKPLTLAIEGGAEQGASLAVDALLDHRAAIKDVVNFQLEQLALSALTLSSNSELPVLLEKGLANISGKLALNGEALDAQIDSLVRQAVFQVAEGGSSEKLATLARALTQVSEFDLDMLVGGSIEQPELGLKSNLDRILGEAVGAEFKAKLAEKQGQLQAKLSETLAPQLSALSGQADLLEPFASQIGVSRDALKSLLGNLR